MSRLIDIIRMARLLIRQYIQFLVQHMDHCSVFDEWLARFTGEHLFRTWRWPMNFLFFGEALTMQDVWTQLLISAPSLASSFELSW